MRLRACVAVGGEDKDMFRVRDIYKGRGYGHMDRRLWLSIAVYPCGMCVFLKRYW